MLAPAYGGAPMQYGAPQPGYGQAPPQMPQQGYGGQAPQAGLRCQMGHEISPGASYCAMGHPIAMDAMPFGGAPADPYGAGGGGGYGQQPQQGGFGAPPPQQGGFGAPSGQPGGFGAPAQQPGGFGAPAQQGQPGGFGAPMQQPGGYYQDPNAGYGQQPQQGGFGAPAPAASPFGAPAQPAYPGMPQQGYDSAPQPGFGGQGSQPNFPVPQQGGFGAPNPSQGQPGFGSQPGFGQGAPAPMAAPSPQAPPLPPAIPEQLPAQALRGFFVSYQTNATGDFWPLHGGRKTVGRANSGESVDIALSDATISSRHAAVNIDGTSGVVTVEDTGSTNGTFVNEEHIGFNGRRDLRDGDKVRFGGYTVIAKIVSR